MFSHHLKTVSISCLLSLSSLLSAQDFTWKKGSALVSQQGTYGNGGISTATNNPGGRAGSGHWQNNNSNSFWLFAGDGFDDVGNAGLLNDMWKYDLTINEWVWLNGSDVIAQPGKYGIKNITSATSRPGSRSHCVSWTDNNGAFWMFGGYGYDSVGVLGYLNDLWRYDPAANNWTWMSGNKSANQVANYGTKNLSSPLNAPGARVGASGWVSSSGHLYMFGGTGYDQQTNVGSLNDLWKYDISSMEWVWIGGSSQTEQSGTYGTAGVSAPGNIPGARKNAMAWKDLSGDFWLLGGFGKDGSTNPGSFLNDLWKYSASTGEWTWVRGSSSSGVNGVYGTQGVASPANDPGARTEGVTWTDAAGTLWLFGGEGYASGSAATGKLNDLWKYDISANVWTWQKSSNMTDQAGLYGSMGVPGTGNGPGGRSLSAGYIDSQSNLYLFGGEGFGSNAIASGALNDLWKYTNCFINPISLTITAQDSTICSGETTSLTATGSNNYLWSQNSTITSYLIIKPQVTTTYTVYSSNANGCIYKSTFTETVSSCAGLSTREGVSDIRIYPNPSEGKITLSKEAGVTGNLLIYNAVGQVVFEKKLGHDEKYLLEPSLPAGIYIYSYGSAGKLHSGKLIIK